MPVCCQFDNPSVNLYLSVWLSVCYVCFIMCLHTCELCWYDIGPTLNVSNNNTNISISLTAIYRLTTAQTTESNCQVSTPHYVITKA